MGEWHVQQTTVDDYSEFIAVEDEDHQFTRHAKKKSKSAPPESLEEQIDSFAEMFDKNAKAGRRAKRNLKWKVLMLRGDRIWTLTTRGGIEFFDEAWRLWGQFERYCSRRFSTFKYVVVMEKHKSGFFHIHFVTNKFFDVSSMRLWWHRILTKKPLKAILQGAESPGNIQVSKALKTRKLGGYLAKYLGKTFECLYSRDDGSIMRVKRFASAKGIGDPPRRRTRMHARMGEHVYRLRNLAEAAGWKVEAIFEGQIAGRRLIWMQCKADRAAASAKRVPLTGPLVNAFGSAYS